MNRTTLVVLSALAFALCAHANPVTITLIPTSGNLVGQPGTAVGWGFTLTNTSSDWVVLTGSSFTGSPVDGTYVDYLSLVGAPLYVAGPAPESSTVSQAWNPLSSPPLGVGEFDINATTPLNTNISGNIVIHYSLFSQDPNDPNFDPGSVVVPDATVSDPVNIAVATPEPSSLTLLLGLPLLLFAAANWRRRLARQ